jgi:hypothetical protein
VTESFDIFPLLVIAVSTSRQDTMVMITKVSEFNGFDSIPTPVDCNTAIARTQEKEVYINGQLLLNDQQGYICCLDRGTQGPRWKCILMTI